MNTIADWVADVAAVLLARLYWSDCRARVPAAPVSVNGRNLARRAA